MNNRETEKLKKYASYNWFDNWPAIHDLQIKSLININ